MSIGTAIIVCDIGEHTEARMWQDQNNEKLSVTVEHDDFDGITKLKDLKKLKKFVDEAIKEWER